MKFETKRLGMAAVAAIVMTTGCKTSAPKPETSARADTAHDQRSLASNENEAATPAPPFAGTAFGKLTTTLKMKTYFANLHAHHFMGVHGSKKNPLTLADALTDGPCHASGTFPMDDGRPCRDVNGVNSTIQSRTPIDFGSNNPDVTDYFRQACEYATHEGALDIFFVTPHTKNNGENEGQLVTSSTEEEMVKRQGMLAAMNPDQAKTPGFYCGLGQEASSISAGNHINIFGQFHAGKTDELPFFFPSGDFRKFYPEIKARNAAGGKVFLQMNHPEVRSDILWWTFEEIRANKKKKKEGLNDYGLDDFAPMGCLNGKLGAETPECAGVSGDRPTPELLKKTFATIRAESGNPFRLIEVIPPGARAEYGEDTDGDGTLDKPGEDGFGATTNSRTSFRAVQHRTDANSYEEGVRNWIFYLAMGFKLGPTANQDNHHMNYGNATASRTGVFATSLKEASVLDALSSRRVFASEDRNARVLLTQLTGATRRLMGDTVSVAGTSTKLNIAYYDPDGKESTAKVRLYYYRANDPIPFGPEASLESAYHTVAFGAKNRITLPDATTAGRSEHDLVPIKNGEVLALDLPLAKGAQWVFAEIVQDGDLDKLWTAPIWIERR